MAWKIHVAGATGNLSRRLIVELKARGAGVRALVRGLSGAQDLGYAYAEVVAGDFDKPECVDAAFGGVDGVFPRTAPSPNQVTHAPDRIPAGKRAGVPSCPGGHPP